MSVTSVAQFTSLLERSDLLSTEQLNAARAELATVDEAELLQLVESFVERDWLTPWQARMLLSGHHVFRLGRYKLLDHLGEGGMGSVFKAEQTPLGRLVAIKTLRKELGTNQQVVARFRREIEVAASLNHPNIVATYDADAIGEQHFLVMEFVEGRDLSELLTNGKTLPVSEACEYIRQAATGLTYAHAQGMVHRDIKPANLLLSDGNDGRPLVKVLDMGLARLDTGSDELTQTGQIMGTPDYIAPEQSRDSRTADARSDVYSLGCTLFRMLTGRAPFAGATAIEKITARLTEPPPPLRSVLSNAPEALEAILLKMMAREPDERYQTADEVAQALAPFAGAETVTIAWRYTADEQKKLSSIQPITQARAGYNEFLQQLERETALKETVISDGREPPGDATVIAAAPSRLQRELEQKRGRDRRRLLWSLLAAAFVILAITGGILWERYSRTTLVVDWPAEYRKGGTIRVDGSTRDLPNTGPLEFISKENHRTISLGRPGYLPINLSWELSAGKTQTVKPDWKPNAGTIRKREWNKLQQEVAIIEKLPTDFEPVIELKHRIESHLQKYEATPEHIRQTGALIAQLPSPFDHLRHNDLRPHELRTAGRGNAAAAPAELVAVYGDSRLQHGERIRDILYSPDGESIVSYGLDGAASVWDVSTGELQRTIPIAGIITSRMAIDGRGRWLVHPKDGVTAAISVLQTGKIHRTLGRGPAAARCAAFSPDDRLVATGNSDATVMIWEAETGNLVNTLEGHQGDVRGVEFNADGTLLASFSSDKTLRIWSVTAGKLLHTLDFPDGHVYDFDFQPETSLLVLARPRERLCDIYQIAADETKRVHQWKAQHGTVRYSSVGTRMVGIDGKYATVYDTSNYTPIRTITPETDGVSFDSVVFSPNSQHLALGCSDGLIRIWNTETWQPVLRPQRVTAADIDADGLRLALATENAIRIIHPATQAQLASLSANGRPIRWLRFVSRRDKLVSFDGRTIQIWNLSRRKVVHSISQRHFDYASPLDISPDGRLLAIPIAANGNEPARVRVWDLDSGSLAQEIAEVRPGIHRLRFGESPDTIFSLELNEVGLVAWNRNTGNRIATHKFDNTYVFNFELFPDNTTIAGLSTNAVSFSSRSSGRFEKEWRHQTPMSNLAYSGGYTLCSSISPDCRSIILAGAGGGLQKYKLQTGVLIKSIQSGNFRAITYHLRHTPNGRHALAVNYNGTACIYRLKSWHSN